MKRRRDEADKEAQAPRRLAPSLQPNSFTATVGHSMGPMAGPSRQLPPVTPSVEQQQSAFSPHQSLSSSSSAFPPSQHSPLKGSQQQYSSQQSRTLPSPSRLQFPAPQPHVPTPTFSSGGPSSHEHTQSSSPAHIQHLQDLQHQISVKTLALQTLQGEYDALLAKLERQRTKCATLEKKFEVSDIEINSLTDERERLLAQVVQLEVQAEELTKGRDDARKEMAESGRQYVRIVEMASRLQAHGADERRKWDDERKELIERIRALELDLTGENETAKVDEAAHERKADFPTSTAITDEQATNVLNTMQNITPSTSAESTSAGKFAADGPRRPDYASGPVRDSPTPLQAFPSNLRQEFQNNVPDLRNEVRRLRSRTQALEATIRNMLEENKTMQETLRGVTTSGERMQAALNEALDAD